MTVRILQGDCRDVLKTLPDESVHCVVTSPPYWGLRDYGTEPQVWGANENCAHDWDGFVRSGMSGGPSDKQDSNAGSKVQQQQQCKKCGAWRGNFGLEPTPQMYVDHSFEVFREVRRVLRDDGTLWLNLGDSYSSHDPGGYREGEFLNPDGRSPAKGQARNRAGNHIQGVPRKNLIGIPWRVAFALQADGWYLRQDIIWSKPNPMPESVRDRCTKAHEYIFLLAKSERYYYDQNAIAEESITAGTLTTGGRAGRASADPARISQYRTENLGKPVAETRNKRSVWEIATQPYTEAHFATFPPDLIEPCILAGCPAGGTVLDPFGGAGTTGLVADRHGRDAILIELNPEYVEMARKRIKGDSPLFAEVRASAPCSAD